MSVHRMKLLRPRRGDTKLRWRGTGICTAPGGVTLIEHEQCWRATWEWPTGEMAWFFWGWRPKVFDDATYWRIGPLTLRRYDR